MSKVASRCYDDDKPVCLFTPAIKTKNGLTIVLQTQIF